EDVIWVEDQPEHFADYHPPQRFQVKRLPEGQTSIQLLENGELDAVSMPRGPSRAGGQVRPLFENPYPHIEDYLQDHPFFPINTVLTLPRATVAKAPGLPAALLVAFQEALDLYRQEVRSGARDDEHSGLHILRLEAETSLRFPDYGFVANRANIETMIRYCYDQGVISRQLDAEAIFLLTDS
ncbi:MAG TPA: hypothetical protein VKU60_08885, partial [Chloroflexota bacterium]|nr:hypothetical protein [Chloroflexota bacterium]